MDPEQKECIEENHNYFVTNMGDVKKVCDFLLSTHVLPLNIIDDIMSEGTTTKQVRELNTQIIKRPKNAYKDYYDALNASGNPHLAQRLKPCLSPKLPAARGGDGQMADKALGDTEGMDPKQRKCIEENHDYFVTNMGDVRKVCDCLLTKKVLTQSIIEDIKSESTHTKQVRELNTQIIKRPKNAYEEYYDALKASGNPHLAQRLEPCLSPKLPAAQGGDGQMADKALGDGMDPSQRKCIEESHDYFVTNMGDVKKVCDYLLSKDVLTRNIIEDIKSESTHTKQVRELNTQIIKRPKNAYEEYYDALKASGNPHLAQRLEPCLSPKLPAAQGGDGQMAGKALGDIMDPEQVKCIEDNHDYFVTNMGDVRKVCDYLLSKDVLTHNIIEDIKVEATHTKQVRALSTQIIKRPNNAYRDYYDALKASGNPHLAQRLEPCLSHKLPPEQGGDGEMADNTVGDGMDPRQRKCIEDNHNYFVTNMGDVRKVCDYLLSKDVLTRNIIEDIKSEGTSTKQVRELNTQIIKRPKNAYKEYYDALKASGNPHLAQRLEPCLSPKLPLAQGGDGEMADKALGATSGIPVASSSQPIMISYETVNRSNLKRVRKALRDSGYTVSMDVDNMMANSYDALERAINNSSVVLMAASRAYTDSEKTQVQCAKKLNKQIILLSMEPKFFDQSDKLSNIEYDSTDDTYTAKSLNALLRGLKAHKND